MSEKLDTIDENDVCSICHEDLNFNSATIASLRNCFHIFHFECVRRAVVEVSQNCPICRRTATKADIQRLIENPPCDESEANLQGTNETVGFFFMQVSELQAFVHRKHKLNLLN